MNKKYLEALEHFVRTSVWNEDEFHEIWDNGNSDLEIVKEALQRLETIDNTKPSEALECIDDIYLNAVFVKKEGQTLFDSHYKLFGESPETHKTISEQCDIIKNALLKAQEQSEDINGMTPRGIIKCPTCGGTNIEKINFVTDANNVVIEFDYRCKDCFRFVGHWKRRSKDE